MSQESIQYRRQIHHRWKQYCRGLSSLLVIVLFYALWAHWYARHNEAEINKLNLQLAVKDQELRGLHEVNSTLKNSSWNNSSRIDRLYLIMDTIKGQLQVYPKPK